VSILLALFICPACEQIEPATPEALPSLDSPARTAGLFWVVREPGTAAVEALEQISPAVAPTGVVLGGAAAPALPGDVDPDDATGLERLTSFENIQANQAPQLSLGIQVAGLGEASPEDVCFDPAAPTADPTLLARRDGLAALLVDRPLIEQVVIAVASPLAPWDRSCSCAPCANTDEQSLASRASVVFEAMQSASLDMGIDTWWWDRTEGAEERMDLAVESGSPASLRATSSRQQDHTWADSNPRLADGYRHQVAADLDLVGSRFGEAHFPRLSPDDLQDRFRRQRDQGVAAWFVAVDDGALSAFGRPEEANVHFAGELFRNVGAEPADMAEAWVAQRYGLAEGSAPLITLAEGLRHTGRAADMVMQPWGLSVDGLANGIPDSLPLVLLPPPEGATAWEERFELAQHPEAETLVAIHQWGAEAIALSEGAVAAVEEAADLLATVDREDLQSRTAHLHATTRGLATLANADFTLRAYQVGPEEDLKEWLRSDAAILEALAFEIDSEVALGQWPTAHPLDSASLLAIATQLRDAVGEGPESFRGFPTITGVRHDFDSQRINFHWTLSPSGSGWVELGSEWPAYDDSSATGPGPAAQWHAWINPEPANSRLTYRPCGISAGFQVCGSDRVVWTTP